MGVEELGVPMSCRQNQRMPAGRKRSRRLVLRLVVRVKGKKNKIAPEHFSSIIMP